MERFMIYGYKEDGNREFINSFKSALRAESVCYDIMDNNKNNFSSVVVWDGAFCCPCFSLERE